MAPDLSVIIVAYRCRDELADCLASLAPDRDGLAVEVTVVDNASGDGTTDLVRQRFGWVRLIANDTNRGFAAANNQGLGYASGRHVLFLNPDTVVHPGALATLVRALDSDEGLGACGPQLLNPDGSIQPSVRRFATFATLLHQYTPLRVLRVLKRPYRAYKMRDFDGRTAADVDVLMGAALAVPRRVLDEVGPMDERFFVYWEEVDLCRRIRAAGHRVRFDPAAKVTHVGGVSAATATASVFFCRSMFRYLAKHHGRPLGRTMAVLLWLGMIVREAGLLAGGTLAAVALGLTGRTSRARRRWAGARRAARFMFRDAWRSLPWA
ncbi:MAG TPA: glycosyltransferase family 2 protein [Phycisphaerae bacterium]|nr:glycosyltransferase family 2 protein [Phycisphaerae bacterium]